jgi:hypothetical protein
VADTEVDAPPGFTKGGVKIGSVVDAPPGYTPPPDHAAMAAEVGKKLAEQQAHSGLNSPAVQGIFEKLNRPTAAAYAKHAGRGYLSTLMHGESPAQYQQDSAKAYHDIGIGEGGDVGDRVMHALAKAALDTGVNPLSLLGMPIKGMTTGQRITQAIEEHGLPAALKAGQAIGRVPGGGAVVDQAAKLHNFLGVHSAAKRALAAKYGPQWVQRYATARARNMAEEANDVRTAAGQPTMPYATPQNTRNIKRLLNKDTKRQLAASPLTKLGNTQADILTAGMFAQPVSHMANISFLGGLVDPGAVGSALVRGTVNNAKKLVGKGETDAAREARLTGQMQHGAVGLHPERENPLDTGLERVANAAQQVPRIGQALSLVPKALRGLYRASGDTLWKFDDEVKAQRWQHLVDAGVHPDVAGLRVGAELVDYGNKSPIAKNLRPVAPFATWRTKAPLSVIRNAIENPGKTQAISSIFPAAVGGKQDVNGKPYVSSLPGAEANELTSGTSGALKYGASSLGPWPRVVQDAIGVALSQNLPNDRRGRAKAKELRTQATYGQEPGTFLLNELPLVGQIMQTSKQGMFNHGKAPPPLQDALSLLRYRPAR